MSTPEGLFELDAIYHFENSPLIAAYTEQPETVQYPDGNRLRHYTPDFELFLADGSSALTRSSMSSTGLPGTSPVSVA